MGHVANIFTHFVGRSSLWTACRNSRRSPGKSKKVDVSNPIENLTHILAYRKSVPVATSADIFNANTRTCFTD